MVAMLLLNNIMAEPPSSYRMHVEQTWSNISQRKEWVVVDVVVHWLLFLLSLLLLLAFHYKICRLRSRKKISKKN